MKVSEMLKKSCFINIEIEIKSEKKTFYINRTQKEIYHKSIKGITVNDPCYLPKNVIEKNVIYFDYFSSTESLYIIC